MRVFKTLTPLLLWSATLAAQGRVATTTTLTSSLNPALPGMTVTLRATVTGNSGSGRTPTGTVRFGPLGDATLVNGVASLSVSSLAVGTQRIVARYSGAPGFRPSVSGLLLQVVLPIAPTTIVVTTSQSPTLVGQPATFTATVTSAGFTPTGAVSFIIDGSPATLPVALSGGVAAFTTSALAVGAHSVSASYGGGASFAPSTSAPITQVVDPSNPLSLTPTSVDFGQVVVGVTSAPSTVTLRNTGSVATGPLSITNAVGDDDFLGLAGASSCPTAAVGGLAAGASCTLVFTFTPTATGPRTRTLTFSATPGGSATLTLVGAGMPVPQAVLSLSPASFDFGSVEVGVSSPATAFTLTNIGTAPSGPLTIGGLLGANPGDFVGDAASTTCTSSGLGVGASCTIGLKFKPQASGSRSATLGVGASPGGTVGATLTGTGLVTQHLAASPDSFDFGAADIGTTTAAHRFVITNTGSVATGPLFSRGIEGTNSLAFGAAPGTCTDAVAVGLAPGASCDFFLTFTPRAAGPQTGSLSFSATPGGSVTIQLRGSGNTPAHLTVAPTTHDFGSSGIGIPSAPQTFTFTNDGGTATGPFGVGGLGGVNPGDFAGVSTTCGPEGLAGHASCVMVLTFVPTALGPRSAALGLSAAGTTAIAALSGTGVEARLISVAPPSHDYGQVGVGISSPVQRFVLTNTGTVATGPLGGNLGGLAGDNPGDFLVDNNSSCAQAAAGLAPGASCNIDVAFRPQAVGPRSAIIGFSANPGGIVRIDLSGTGVLAQLLSVTPTSFDFGTLNPGTTSAPHRFTITNNGTSATGPLVTGGFTGANPEAFAGVGASSTCDDIAPVGLAAGASCDLDLTFTPPVDGSFSASLTFGATPGGTVTMQVTGSAVFQLAAIILSPTTWDFGPVLVGQEAEKVFTVTNASAAPVQLLSQGFFSPGPGFSLDGSSTCLRIAMLDAGATCNIGVRFIPPSAGPFSQTLQVFATGGLTATAAVSGTGTSPVSITPTTWDFGPVLVGQEAEKVFTVTNASAAPVQLLSQGFFSPGPGFSLDGSSTCLRIAMLDAGATCNIGVRFIPPSAGPFSQTLQVFVTGGLTATAAVSGTGTLPVLSITPTTHDFGTVTIGQTSRSVVFQINLNFFESISAGSVGVTGPGATAYVVQGGEACSADLTVSGSGFCQLVISFAPTATGPQPATFIAQIRSAAGTTYTATSDLTGTGVAPIVLSVTPSSRDFGSVIVGGASPSATFTVTNPSTSKLTLDPITVTGTNPADFVVGPGKLSCASLLEPGAFCDFTVTFSPKDVGARAASVTISAGPATSATTVALTGSGAPALTIAPTSQDFGSILLGQSSAAIAFTVTNVGPASVLINNFVVAGHFNDFTVAPGTCGPALATGGSCTFTVTFTPTALGGRAATVTVVGTGGTPTVSATLTGTGGGVALLAFTPTSHDFGSRQINFRSGGVFFFTVTNAGGSATGVLDRTGFTGPAAADFSADPGDNGCAGTSLAPGASCTLSVQFIPTALGTRSATLTLSSSIGSASGSAQVTGTGVPPAVLTVTPSSKDFGSVDLGQTSPLFTFTVTNTGPSPGGLIVTESFSGPGRDDYSDPFNACNSVQLDVGTSCQIRVAFHPTAGGPRPATFTMVFQGGTATFDVTGIGSSPNSLLTIAPDSQDFGVVFLGQSSAARTLTVTNIGRASSGSLVNFLFSGPGAFEFFVASNQCDGRTLAPGATCTIGLTFKPQSYGVRKATFTASDGGLAGTATLTGGMVPGGVLSMTPTSASFGTVAVGASSAAIPFTVTNSGSTIALFSEVFIDDPAGDDYTLDPSGSCASTPSLGIGASCTVLVHFAPKRTGPLPATLYVSYDAGTVSAVLTGTGTDQPRVALRIAPDTFQFTSIPVGTTSPPATFTITNLLSVRSGTINSFVITGVNTTDYLVSQGTCAGAALDPGGSCTFSVTFAPQIAGGHGSTLTVRTSAGETGTTQLRGFGIVSAVLSITPASHDFGFQFFGQSAPVTFTVTNSGGNVGAVLDFSFGGPNSSDFFPIVDGYTCAYVGQLLLPGASCTIGIFFQPQVLGPRSATFTVTDIGGLGTNHATATLTGGVTPGGVLTISPTSRNFGSVPVGLFSLPTEFIVSNVGTTIAVLSGVAIIDPAGSDYVIEPGTLCGPFLDVGASCSIFVSFVPLKTGPLPATLLVSYDAGTVSASLTGTGAPAGTTLRTPAASRTAAASRTIELTPFTAADATRDLLGVATLSPARRSYLDLLGNHDGSYDLGDLVAFLDRHHIPVSPALLQEHPTERVP